MKDLLKKYQLPKRIEVILHKAEEGGFVVEFPKFPGCFTQVEELSQLQESVTDAILTYLDVPRPEAKKIAYLPETKVIENAREIKKSRVSAQGEFDLFVAA